MNPWLIGAPVALTAGAALTAYGAVHPRSELFGSTVWRTASAQKLAITFDDGPNPKITPELLELLERHNAKATFFVLGQFATQCPELVREIAQRGHQLGNHTATHANLFWCTPQEIRDQLRRCSDSIAEVTGYSPSCFRPPFGFRNPWVISIAAALGMTTVTWTNLPGDWRGKPAEWLIPRMSNVYAAAFGNKTGLTVEKQGLGTKQTRRLSQRKYGDIVCLHDGDFRFLNADRTGTVEALRYWLPRWRDVGLEFVTIDQAVHPTTA